MSAALEQRYRRALRWYPTRWRERHGEVVLSTLLDGADAEGRATPARGELLNLAVTGVATRGSAVLPTGVRDLISTAALATGTVLAVAFFTVFSWAPWATVTDWEMIARGSFGPFINPGPLVYALWPIALSLFLLRRYAAMRWVLGLAVLVPPLLRLSNWLQGDVWFGPMATTLGMFMLLAAATLLGTPSRGARMLVAIGFATAVASVMLAASGSIQGYVVWERAFWMLHTSPIEWIVLGMLALAVVLGIARRPSDALFSLTLVGPWAVVVGAAAVRTDPHAAAGLAFYAVVLIAAASLVALAIRRSRDALRERANTEGRRTAGA
ncbi:hypothetical protein OH146_07160 [Salinibacterium sp. SYSU T00001]|uniref:hypothetical protein n=1 Tax=Homoserinimonas sedimenticola TaxID=2986805 RepID=UPI002235B1A5|nr:hypothetical protein [Salinibacterium sedimenticola]MCW4385550.1 hypothetical protein [Salinibacterium sedimenticola]